MTLNPVDYDKYQHQVYREARSMPPGMCDRWMEVFAEYLPARRPLAILDLGSGTGRFAPALAERFGGPVYGVEPSAQMRAQAEATSHVGLTYFAGKAEDIPLGDQSVDGVLMFLSFHHVRNRVTAAREISRVLKPSGKLLLRGVFGDRLPEVWWAPFFPGWQEMQAAMFPTLAVTRKLFAEVGLCECGFKEISEQYASTPEEAIARLKLKGISGFDHFTDEAIAIGFEKLDAAFSSGTLEVPLCGHTDLLVLERR